MVHIAATSLFYHKIDIWQGLNCNDLIWKVTVQPAPFVKPHCVLIAAAPLFYSFTGAQLICLSVAGFLCKHKSVFWHQMAELLQKIDSSARAIRKTALRAYCGWRRCFTHLQALSSSACQQPDSYASINPSPDTRWLNWYYVKICRTICVPVMF